jgi:uncharacterized membrane protein
MLDFIYNVLAAIGYTDPVHPPLAHMPIGLTVGALLLGLSALLARRPILGLSAHHCLILALIFVFPTVLLGYMDWQRYYAGAWLFPIKMKLGLAGVLLVLLTLGVVLGRKEEERRWGLIGVYTLSFFTVTGLGYFGGHLVFGGNAPAAPAEFQAGQKVFTACSGCHAHGGNIIDPKLTLRNAPQLEAFDKFRDYIRDPEMPDGSPGEMPAFGKARISDQQARELYDYIIHVIVKPKRE